jgi:hypothetical protein
MLFVLIRRDGVAMRFGLLKENKLPRQLQIVEHGLHLA